MSHEHGVETTQVGDEFVVLVPPHLDGSHQHNASTEAAAQAGFPVLDDEYFDLDLDCIVYVFAGMGEDGLPR